MSCYLKMASYVNLKMFNKWKENQILSPNFTRLILVLFTFIAIVGSQEGQTDSAVRIILDDNWTDMLEGEWLVKFYAPWCPACQSLAPVWERLGQRSAQLGLTVAQIDVTESAALSGRFFITSLPTIYHIKDGVFRLYQHSKTEQDVFNFVLDKKWKDVDPVPWYRCPSSYHMMALGWFFQGSISIRNLHSSVTTEYGIPMWVSYVVIAIVTILVGLALGLFLVCLCDLLGRIGRRPHPVQTRPRHPGTASGQPNSGDNASNMDAAGDESDILDDLDREPPTRDHKGSPSPRADIPPSETEEHTVRHRAQAQQ